MKHLVNRVAVVTGAASGIGCATSISLASEGCYLAIADVNEAGLEETASDIQRIGQKVVKFQVDVSDWEAMNRFAKDVVDTYGHVHLLINNAGVAVNDLVYDGSLKDFEWIMSINFWGTVYGCKSFLPYLLKETEGHIVNISSIFGLAGLPSQATYCSTKFAVRGFTEALRAELSKSRVRVSCVHPGGVRTNIEKSARFRKATDGCSHEEMIEVFEKLVRLSPEQAASILVKKIKQNKRRILIGSDAKILDWISRIFPSRYDYFLKRFFTTLYPKNDLYA